MSKGVLGIESSCDESAVAIVTETGQILAHEILSQEEHSHFGGVVPEIAARGHFTYLHLLISKAMKSARMDFTELDAIAVTAGPGLIGSLIVGTMLAKAISYVTNRAIIAVNHLEAHALVVRMTHELEFPFLLFIISGGHCQFLIAREVGIYVKLGKSLDDSLGETFDKVARMLGLGYPGGPMIESKAVKGRGDRFFFPRALQNRQDCNFSFSGLKTAIRDVIGKETLDEQTVFDVCASFQQCVSEILVNKISNAIAVSRIADKKISTMVVTGGVAANLFLRNTIAACASNLEFNVIFPPQELCTDNGVMVAWAGIENIKKGNTSTLDFAPRARWPLGDPL